MHERDRFEQSSPSFTISTPCQVTLISAAPVARASEMKKSPGTPYKEAPKSFKLAIDERDWGLEDIPQLMGTIKLLEEKAEKLFQLEYNENRKSCLDSANHYIQNEKLWMEPLHSTFYPIISYQDMEDLEPRDQHHVDNILRTATITKLELPEFNCLVDKNDSKEYFFELWFGFGTDYATNCQLLYIDCEMKKLLPRDCCNIIAGMLGSTRFDIKLKVYFDKVKEPNSWHEQDGEAWIYYKGGKTNIKRDLVNFDCTERIYYVEDWPVTGLICGSYDQPALVERLERTIISWLCSQVTFLAFEKIRYTQSIRVRKALNRLLFVLKGWYTGLLLGESFDPDYGNEMFKD